MRTIDDNQPTPAPSDYIPVSVDRSPKFADVTYDFPVTTMTIIQPKIDLSEIDEVAIEQAARRVTSTGDVLYRKEIVAALGCKLRGVDAESAVVDSIHVGKEDAAEPAYAENGAT